MGIGETIFRFRLRVSAWASNLSCNKRKYYASRERTKRMEGAKRMKGGDA